MRGITSVIALAAGLFAGTTAHAQSWGVYVGNGGEPGYYRDRGDDGLARAVCSGERAHRLEARLNHEVDEDEIDGDDADRIHSAIDRLEDRERHECAEGDRRAIRDIAFRYDRIGRWIDTEAHSYERQGW